MLVMATGAFVPERTLHAQAPASHFETSDKCLACHNGLVTPAGEDISLGTAWGSTMMANSARDPYWQAAVRRETRDHPKHAAEIENECAACHMPMSRYDARSAGRLGGIFEHLPARTAATREAKLAVDGVSCTTCHRMTDANFGTRAGANAGFEVEPPTTNSAPSIYGPFEIEAGQATIMRSATGFEPKNGAHVQSSELCATCHTLYTKAFGPDGSVVGELPEQMPYLEWRHSRYRSEKSCQACHMPVVAIETPVSSVLGEPRADVSRHTFAGANFFIPRMMSAHRAELGVTALPAELDATAKRAETHLAEQAARLTVAASRDGARVVVDVGIENLAGHKLPTAYPSRRAWLHVAVRDPSGQTVYESGRLQPNGSIAGNDNDEDPARYEPHYREIREPGQVQIYEAILADPGGRVTTGLLTAVGYLKDNRILPDGFDKGTAEPDIAVHGDASDDANFIGGRDLVRYDVAVSDARGPFVVEVTLWYQPIAYRWAQNLRRQQGEEIDRFVGYYERMASGSAAVVARATGVAK
jgi:hypothetical protein